MYWLLVAYALSGMTGPGAVAYGPYDTLKGCKADIASIRQDIAEFRETLKNISDQTRKEAEDLGIDPQGLLERWFEPLCVSGYVSKKHDQWGLVALNETRLTQEMLAMNMEANQCSRLERSHITRQALTVRAIETGDKLVLDCARFDHKGTYSAKREADKAKTPEQRKAELDALLVDICIQLQLALKCNNRALSLRIRSPPSWIALLANVRRLNRLVLNMNE